MKYIITLSLLLLSITVHSQSWPLTAKLQAGDQENADNHGYAVSISGNYAVVGAFMEDHDPTGGSMLSNSGSAYIYKYDSTTKTWTQEAKLVAADRSATAFFGYTVAISGTYAVIGAVQDSASCGAAYVFERSGTGTWTQVAKLVATSRRASDRFGVSVAISGDTIVVGAHHEDEDETDANTISAAGSAYIFARDGSGSWNFDQKIVASDRDLNDEFGISVGIDADRIIVGAYRHDGDTALNEKGAAYVFAYSSGTWTQIKILQATDRYDGDEFGWSVDVSGNYFIVGAPKHDYDSAGGNNLLNPGAAYVFDETNSWAESKVAATDRADQDNYGQSVAIWGDMAVVGAPLQNFGPPGQTPPVLRSDGGAAYVIEEGTSGMWTQVKKLIADSSDRFAGDKLGYSVDIYDDEVIAGAPEDNVDATPPIPSAGAAYIYREDTATSVGNIIISEVVEVYPNPAWSMTYINLKTKVQQLNITVQDINGATIRSYSFMHTDNAAIDISGLHSGLYMLNIEADDIQYKSTRLVKY